MLYDLFIYLIFYFIFIRIQLIYSISTVHHSDPVIHCRLAIVCDYTAQGATWQGCIHLLQLVFFTQVQFIYSKLHQYFWLLFLQSCFCPPPPTFCLDSNYIYVTPLDFVPQILGVCSFFLFFFLTPVWSLQFAQFLLLYFQAFRSLLQLKFSRKSSQ